MKISVRSVLCGVLATAAIGVSGIAVAQPYPSKPIRMIFPFPPGGPTDLLGRAIAQKMSDQMGQQVVADNRPGAGGNLGLDLTAKSPADGYTIVLTSPLIALGPLLYRFAYEPLGEASMLALLIASMALHFVLIGIGLYAFGAEGVSTPALTDTSFAVGSIDVSGQSLCVGGSRRCWWGCCAGSSCARWRARRCGPQPPTGWALG